MSTKKHDEIDLGLDLDSFDASEIQSQSVEIDFGLDEVGLGNKTSIMHDAGQDESGSGIDLGLDDLGTEVIKADEIDLGIEDDLLADIEDLLGGGGDEVDLDLDVFNIEGTEQALADLTEQQDTGYKFVSQVKQTKEELETEYQVTKEALENYMQKKANKHSRKDADVLVKIIPLMESEIDAKSNKYNTATIMVEFLGEKRRVNPNVKYTADELAKDFLTMMDVDISRTTLMSNPETMLKYTSHRALADTILKLYARVDADKIQDERANANDRIKIQEIVKDELKPIQERLAAESIAHVPMIRRTYKGEIVIEQGQQVNKTITVTEFECGECGQVSKADNMFVKRRVIDYTIARDLKIRGRGVTAYQQLAVKAENNTCEHCGVLNTLPEEATRTLTEFFVRTGKDEVRGSSTSINIYSNEINPMTLKNIIGEYVDIQVFQDDTVVIDNTMYTPDKVALEYDAIRNDFDEEIRTIKLSKSIGESKQQLSKVATNYLASMVNNDFYGEGYKADIKAKMAEAISESNMFRILEVLSDNLKNATFDLVNVKKYEKHLNAIGQFDVESMKLRSNSYYDFRRLQENMEKLYGITALEVYTSPEDYMGQDVDEKNLEKLKQVLTETVVEFTKTKEAVKEKYNRYRKQFLSNPKVYEWATYKNNANGTASTKRFFEVLGADQEVMDFLDVVTEQEIKLKMVQLLHDLVFIKNKDAENKLSSHVRKDRELMEEIWGNFENPEEIQAELDGMIHLMYGTDVGEESEEDDLYSDDAPMRAETRMRAFDYVISLIKAKQDVKGAHAGRKLFEKLAPYFKEHQLEYLAGDKMREQLKYLNDIFKGFVAKDYFMIADKVQDAIDNAMLQEVIDLAESLSSTFNRETYMEEIKKYHEHAGTVVNMRGVGFEDEEVFEFLQNGGVIPSMPNYPKRGLEDNIEEWLASSFKGKKVQREFEDVLQKAYIENPWIETMSYKYAFFKHVIRRGDIPMFKVFQMMLDVIEDLGNERLESSFKEGKAVGYSLHDITIVESLLGTTKRNMARKLIEGLDAEGEFKVPETIDFYTPEDVIASTVSATRNPEILKRISESTFEEVLNAITTEIEIAEGKYLTGYDNEALNILKYAYLEIEPEWTDIPEAIYNRKEWVDAIEQTS